MEKPTTQIKTSVINVKDSSHLKQHQILKQLICFECRAKFSNKIGNFEKHVRTRHSYRAEELLTKECRICDLIFEKRYLYHLHYL